MAASFEDEAARVRLLRDQAGLAVQALAWRVEVRRVQQQRDAARASVQRLAEHAERRQHREPEAARAAQHVPAGADGARPAATAPQEGRNSDAASEIGIEDDGVFESDPNGSVVDIDDDNEEEAAAFNSGDNPADDDDDDDEDVLIVEDDDDSSAAEVPLQPPSKAKCTCQRGAAVVGWPTCVVHRDVLCPYGCGRPFAGPYKCKAPNGRTCELLSRQEPPAFNEAADGADPTGCTNVGNVTHWREEFRRWCEAQNLPTPTQHQDSQLTTHRELRKGAVPVAAFIKSLGPANGTRATSATAAIKRQELDSRLSAIHTYLCWGMSSKDVYSSMRSTYRDRVLHLVDRKPRCFYVPQLDADSRGRYFEAITRDWIDRHFEELLHGWNDSLHGILQNHVGVSVMQSDVRGLIDDGLDAEQPTNCRYVCESDWIGMWNRSGGKCVCGKDIYIGWDANWGSRKRPDPELGAPTSDQRATVQRIHPRIMHLAYNCADRLICMSCQAYTNYNPVHDENTMRMPMRDAM